MATSRLLPARVLQLLWVVPLLAAFSTSTHAQARIATAPSAADLVGWSKQCLKVAPVAWPAIDDLHDGLLDKLRALPVTSTESLQRQAALEDEFLAAMCTLAKADEACRQAVSLERREARARSFLSNVGIRPRMPDVSHVCGEQLSPVDPQLQQLRLVVVAALERMVTQAQGPTLRQLASDMGARNPLSKEEQNCVRAFLQFIDGQAATLPPEDCAKLRDRLALSVFNAPRDSEGERIAIILSNLRDVSADEQAALQAYVDALPARRRAARKQVLEALMRGIQEWAEIRAPYELGFVEIPREDFDSLVPERLRRNLRDYIYNWTSIGGLREGISERVTEAGVVQLEPFLPTAKQDARLTTGRMGIPSYDAEAMTRALCELALQPTPSQRNRQYLQEVFRSWCAVELPTVESCWSDMQAAEKTSFEAGHSDADRGRKELLFIAAQLRFLAALSQAEIRMQPVLPEFEAHLGDPKAITSVWRAQRMVTALSARLLESTSFRDPSLPVATTPVPSVLNAIAPTPALKAQALAACAESSARQFQSVQTTLQAHLRAEGATIAHQLNRSTGAQGAADTFAGVPLEFVPAQHGGSLPARGDASQDWEREWADWLTVCGTLRKELVARLPQEYSDEILTRWALDCYPVLRTVADWSVLDATPAKRPLQTFATRARRNLRALADQAFAPRTRNPGPVDLSWPPLIIHALLEQIEEDSRNSRTRLERDAG